MKIVYIASSIIPSRTANSIHVMKMCHAFAKNGHEVTLIVPRGRNNEEDVADCYGFYGVERSFEIVRVPWARIKGTTNLFGFLAAFKTRRIKPDVVYGRHVPACYFAAMFQLPVGVELHAPPSDKGRLYDHFYSLLTKHSCFRFVVFITRALASHCMSESHVIRADYMVAPDGADPVGPNVCPVFHSDVNRLAVGYAGSLYSGKGAEVVATLAERCPWADFHIVGGSKNEVSDWRKRYKNQTNLILHGHVKPSDVQRYLLSFDILLLPNQQKVHGYIEQTADSSSIDIGKWTSPLKLFEYMAAGKPIVCSSVPVLMEVVKDRVNAIVCDPEDIDAWVSAIILLRDNPDLKERIGTNAKKEFLESYTWHERANQISSLINDKLMLIESRVL